LLGLICSISMLASMPLATAALASGQENAQNDAAIQP